MAEERKLNPTIKAYLDAFEAGLDYSRPYWEMFGRHYQFWKNHTFEALEGTFSRINLALGHSMVQDRLPKIHQNVFGHRRLVSVMADSPMAEITAPKAETWLRDVLTDKIRIQAEIHPTLQSVLFGGTAYRMPGVTYVKKETGDGWKPVIYSRDIEFFHVIPAPGGGHVNPLDNEQTNAVPWVMVVDWLSETKIRALAEKGSFNKEEVGKMLDARPNQQTYLEDAYRNKFAVVDNLQYGGQDSWRGRMFSIDDNAKRRRVVHWFRRDKHIIIGEDAYVLRDGPPIMKGGKIPLAKYLVCPDLNNWYGISYLGMMEDLLKALVMNFNYRMDYLIRQMFPTTYVRQDIMDHGKYTNNDFIPKPYDVKTYPKSIRDQKISDLIYHDRQDGIDQQTFVDEDRMKAWLQKLAGQTETTSSMNDVVGNRTATGVTSILAELAGRPNMESIILENHGFREECDLILELGRIHVNEPMRVKDPSAEDGFPWIDLEPDDLSDQFTVVTHGTQYLADRNLAFQKMVAMYPFWNQNPAFDAYELASQSLEVSEAFPRPEKLITPRPPVEAAPGGPQPGAAPGGMASSMDLGQRTRSTRNRNTVEPKTGRAVRAGP